MLFLNFTLSHSDIQQREEEKPGDGQHRGAGSGHRRSVCVTLCAAAHDNKESNSTLRQVRVTERNVRSTRAGLSLLVCVVAREEAKISPPEKEKEKKKKPAAKIGEKISIRRCESFCNHTKLWQFRREEAGASPSASRGGWLHLKPGVSARFPPQRCTFTYRLGSMSRCHIHAPVKSPHPPPTTAPTPDKSAPP